MFDPLDNEWLKNKHSYYRELRQDSPVYWSSKYSMYVITRYEDVKALLKNNKVFLSGSGNLIMESPHRFGHTLGASDLPFHDVLKDLVKSAYGKQNLDRILANTTFTIGTDLNTAIEYDSARFTAELLNIPESKKLITDIIVDIQKRSSKSVVTNTNDASYNYYLSLVKKSKEPLGEGIYKEYYNSNKQYLSLMSGPTLSGTTSTTGALQFLIVDLANNPDQYKLLLKDDSLIPATIEESIRYNSSTGRFSRTASEDFNLHGVLIKKGSRVALCIDSANRDESVFEDSDRFDISREYENAHLGFGYGMHSCIAMYLTRMFMNSYLQNFVKQVSHIDLVNTNPDRRIMCSGNFDVLNSLNIKDHLP